MSVTEHTDVSTERVLDKRFERIGWGLFLIMIGGLLIVPDRSVPGGAWLVGTGLIMLGLNAARYLSDIKMSGFTIVLGFLALSIGLSDMAGADLPIVAILLVLCGIHIIYRSLFEKALS